MRLLMIDDLSPTEKECNLVIIIKEIGSWVVKMRHSGVIFNNRFDPRTPLLLSSPSPAAPRDLVMVDHIHIDGTLSFASAGHFHQMMLGAQTVQSLVAGGHAQYAGDQTMLAMLSNKFYKSSDSIPDHNASLPVRSGRLTSAEAEQPLKTGWLLKKRDIMTGWKCRYFEVYPGRLDYYSDQYSMQPRGSISLWGALVHPVKTIKVKRVKDYSGIVIESKTDKILRLASERTGLDGMVEANTWHQVFQIATKAPEHAPSPLPSSPVTRSSRYPVQSAPLIPQSRDAEDKIGFKQMLLYAGGLLALVLAVHYLYLYKQWINTKIYIAFLVILTVMLVIFIQEFLMPVEDNELHSTNSKKPLKKAISQMVLSMKAAASKASSKDNDSKPVEQEASSPVPSSPPRASSPKTPRPISEVKKDPHNTSMIVHFDSSSDEEEDDEDEAEDGLVAFEEALT